jgi:hypothetical protein
MPVRSGAGKRGTPRNHLPRPEVARPARTAPALPIPLAAVAQPSRSCAASGAVNLASASKSLARNRKSCTSVAATKGRFLYAKDVWCFKN